jgi:Putative transposase, YhgA-like
LRYILNALEQDKKGKRVLTLTIPIVIYHGTKAWKYKSMSQYFKGLDTELTKFVPDFEYLLIDISKFSDDEIFHFRNRFLALSFLLLKNSRIKKYLSIIEESLIDLMRDIENQGDMNYITSVFVYSLFTNQDLTKREVISIFRKVSLKSEQATMTTGELMIKEGRLEGMALFIKGMLKMGMDAPTIASSFGLSNKEVKEVVDKIQKGLL